MTAAVELQKLQTFIKPDDRVSAAWFEKDPKSILWKWRKANILCIGVHMAFHIWFSDFEIVQKLNVFLLTFLCLKVRKKMPSQCGLRLFDPSLFINRVSSCSVFNMSLHRVKYKVVLFNKIMCSYLIPCWFCKFAHWQRNYQSVILMVGLFEQWGTE